MTETLKPCPFCGSDRTTIWNAGGGQQAVCKNCRTTGPVFTCQEAWRQAFTAWNIRAPVEPDKTSACELCNDKGVWPTADGVGHRCSCGAGA